MQSVKIPTSKSYEDYLIKSLKDPEEAAAYITAILEESDPEPELLPLCLGQVASALGDEKDRLWVKDFSTNAHSPAIHELTEWLDSLGLRLMVTTKQFTQTEL